MAEHNIQMGTDVDFRDNQLLNMRAENLAEVPSEGTLGRIIYLTADNKLYLYNGSWVEITTSDSGDYQLISEKDQPGGYAGLDGSGKIVIGEIPTGVDANTVPLIVQQISSGQSIKYDSSSGGFVPFDISTIYKFKSTTTSAGLDAVTDPEAGDVYSLTDEREFEGETYEAGTNWVWDASDSRWEPLTGILDLTGYQTLDNLVTAIDSSSTDSQYPSAKCVYDVTNGIDTRLTTAEGEIDTLQTDVVAAAAAATAAATAAAAAQSDVDALTERVAAIEAGEAAVLKATITGTGSATSFTVDHADLGHVPIMAIYDPDGDAIELARTSTETETVIYFGTAPASGETYTVVMI